MATDNQQTARIATAFSLDALSAQSHRRRSHELSEASGSVLNNRDLHSITTAANAARADLRGITLVSHLMMLPADLLVKETPNAG